MKSEVNEDEKIGISIARLRKALCRERNEREWKKDRSKNADQQQIVCRNWQKLNKMKNYLGVAVQSSACLKVNRPDRASRRY